MTEITAKHLSDEEISKILGYKNLKSYLNSKKSKEAIDNLLFKHAQIIEIKHKKHVESLKESLLQCFKSF